MTHSNPEHDSVEMVNARMDAELDDYIANQAEQWEEDEDLDDEILLQREEDDRFADGDALASAGWGTDEDYGCFDSGDDF